MKIKVTIGVCVRNCENDVSNIFSTISDQDFPHDEMEVIIVEEGSDDNTLSSILQILPTLDLKYKLFHHKWKGLGYSRNEVLMNAAGEYIVWIDDGTRISKNYIRQNIEFLEKNPDVGITKGLINVYCGSNRIAALENMQLLVFHHKNSGKFITKMLGIGGSVYRVKAARLAGGFDERIHGAGEDTDIAFRILLAGWRVYMVRVKLYNNYAEKYGSVWVKNFWYGYGSHFTLHKHNELRDILYKSTPFAGFFEGLLTFSTAYKLTHKTIAFLLPIHFIIERTAWCLGFLKSHRDSYGH